MATITATYDPDFDRVRITIAAALAGDTLVRVNSDNVASPVRAADPLLLVGGGWAGDDYEFPHGLGFQYEVRGSDGIASATAVVAPIASTRSWLKSPTQPTLNVPISLISNPEIKRTRPRGVHVVLGRSDPIVTSGTQSSKSGTLGLFTGSREADEALGLFLAETPVALLVTPGSSRVKDAWVSLGDVDEATVSRWIGEEAVRRSVEFVEVTRPPGGIYGDPTASYQSILNTYATYSALRAGKATYLDVLRGVGAPVLPPNPGAF